MKFCPVVPEICRGQVHGARKERRIIITRYDYNLTIMKSPKPATDTIYPHIKFWWYRTMLNFYPPFLCRVLATILKMADILKILKMQNCSSNGDYVKIYVSIIIQLEVININYSNPHPFEPPKIWLWPPLPQIWKL